jgi:iron complex outermembrane receptor protein
VSLFAQPTVHLARSLRVIGGVRYIDEKKRADLGQAGVALLGFPTYSRSERIKDNKVLLNGAVEFDLHEHAMLYGSYSQGYKAGGFNFFDLRNNNPIFEAESSDGYEVGIKSELFDRRVRLNVAAFLTDFSNLQVSTFNGTSLVVSNAASARSKGIEAEVNWKVTPDLQLNASGALLRARYRDYPTGPCTIVQQLNTVGPCVQDLSGRTLERAPDESGVFNVTYRLPLSSIPFDITLAGDAIYSSSYHTVNDLDPVGFQKGFWMLNGRIGLSDKNDRWSAALVGKNLTNKAYLYSGNDVFQFAGSHGVLLGEPRQVDLQLRYRW